MLTPNDRQTIFGFVLGCVVALIVFGIYSATNTPKLPPHTEQNNEMKRFGEKLSNLESVIKQISTTGEGSSNTISNTLKKMDTISEKIFSIERAVANPPVVPIKSAEDDGHGYMHARLAELQKVIDEAAGGREHVIGNIAWHAPQTHYYWYRARDPQIKVMCEIGYGAGHTAVMLLSANAHSKLVVFDLFPAKYDPALEMNGRQHLFQPPSIKYVENKWPGRMTMVAGDSTETIPKFTLDNPGYKCDLISIDGSHAQPNVYKDIMNMRKLAHKDTVVLLDDMVPELYAMLQKTTTEGITTEYECLLGARNLDPRYSPSPHFYTHGKRFCEARYIKFD
jgi:hypothetical protein